MGYVNSVEEPHHVTTFHHLIYQNPKREVRERKKEVNNGTHFTGLQI